MNTDELAIKSAEQDNESDQALNACITFVIHGDADFSGMNEGLVDYFKKSVSCELLKQYEADQGEAVAVVDANDEAQWADILPDRSVKVGQKLYARPDPNVKELEAEVEGLKIEVTQCDKLRELQFDSFTKKVAELERRLAVANKRCDLLGGSE